MTHVCSMTAFCRQSCQKAWGAATWEVRSVNHRYLDIHLRLPDALRGLEMAAREQVAQYLKRGKVDLSLRFEPGEAVSAQMTVNHALVEQLARAAAVIETAFAETQPVRPFEVLKWPGVLHSQEHNLDMAHTDVLQLLTATLTELVTARRREGAALTPLLTERLDKMIVHVDQLKPRQADILQTHRDKLMHRLSALGEAFDQTRLEQEMVLFAQKMDVAEELERLLTHITEMQNVLKHGGGIGRRLDFLLQEMNREANTLASKSIDVDTTHTSVELKVLIEQMREQVQNIE